MRSALVVSLLWLVAACGSGDGLYTQEEVDALIEEAVAEALASTTTDPPTTEAATTTSPSTTPTAATADLADFMVELIVVEKQCFGSAGCNVTIEPELFYDGPPLPSSARYTLVYEVQGGEDGPLTFNIDIEGDSYSYDQELISTARSEDELTVELVRLLSR